MIPQKVDKFYYSKRKFGLTTHHYRELWRNVRNYRRRVLPRTDELLEYLPESKSISEDILKKHNLKTKPKGKNREILTLLRSEYQWSIKKSKKEYYEATHLFDIKT